MNTNEIWKEVDGFNAMKDNTITHARSNIENENRRLIMVEKLYTYERLKHLANILAEHCHRDLPCIFDENIVSTCPFEYSQTNCKDITSADWLKYMQGSEVSE